MAYLYIIIAVTLLFIALHKMTELPMKTKVGIAIGAFIIVMALYFFEKSNTHKAHEKQKLLFAFNHGKSLVCNGKEVNNTLYNYASRSFIGKKGTSVFASPNIPASHCIVKP
jgi:hypothetical protein